MGAGREGGRSSNGVGQKRSSENGLQARPTQDHLRKSPSPQITYHDICLYEHDIADLKQENSWFSDSHIAFWQEYIEHEILIHHKRCRIVLLRPTVALWLMHSNDRLDSSWLPDLTKATHAFIPVNDKNSFDDHRNEGTHWSLLLVSITDGLAFHYDSLHLANYDSGKLAAARMSMFLGKQLTYVNVTEAPQQNNGSDCGPIVCMLMEYLITTKLLRTGVGTKISMTVPEEDVNLPRYRQKILEKVKGLL